MRYQVDFKVEHGEGGKLLYTYLTGKKKLSEKALKRIKREGQVLVNGMPVLLKSAIYEGDRILLIYPPEKRSEYLIPEDVPINIVYEDEDILVLDKQAGICVHPTKHYPGKTLANGVMSHWQTAGENSTPHFVNRLDKDTTGLILVAKSTYGAQQLFRQQSDGIIQRSYLALVIGEMAGESGTVDLPIAREDNPTIKRIITMTGQSAVTHYSVKKRLPGYTLLSLQLETGRTHQIRVHLSHLGHPILGDALYGGESTLLKRQFLHAFRLAFYHPVRQKEMVFTSNLPEELTAVLQEIEHKFNDN